MKLPLAVSHQKLEDADGKCVAASFWAGRQISDFDDDETNLCDIARAVNNHAALVAALEAIWPLALCHAAVYQIDHALPDLHPEHKAIIDNARAALAATKGETDASN